MLTGKKRLAQEPDFEKIFELFDVERHFSLVSCNTVTNRTVGSLKKRSALTTGVTEGRDLLLQEFEEAARSEATEYPFLTLHPVSQLGRKC